MTTTPFMKIYLSTGLAFSLIFSSCGTLDSSAVKDGDGIHQNSRIKGVAAKATKKKSGSKLSSAKSPNGFHPAPVSASFIQKGSRYGKDKHGYPTYPHKVRNRYVRTTAYSHEENEVGAPWRKNALGTYLKYGTVRSAAADWSRYPVGTKFKIAGLPHTYVVDDYGSALVGTNTVDIYHPNLRSMRRWGTQKAKITVLQWGSWERTLKILKGRLKYKHTRKMYYAAKAKVDSGKVAVN